MVARLAAQREALAEPVGGGGDATQHQVDRAVVEERAGDVRGVSSCAEQAEAFPEERLGALIVSDGQREVAEVVDRKGSDPFVPGGARARHRFLQRRLGALTIACREQDRAQVAQRVGDEAWIVVLAGGSEGLVREADRRSMVTLEQPEGRHGCEGSSALRRRLVGGRLECELEPCSPLGEVTAHVPIAAERHGQRQLLLGGARGLEVVERRPQIVVLGLEQVEPLGLLILAQMALGLVREREAPFRETGTRPVGVRGVGGEQLGGVLVDRLEQRESRPAPVSVRRTRWWSISIESTSRRVSQTASAASTVAPARATDSRASAARSSSRRSPTLQSIVSRSVCCRAGRS